MLWMFMMFLLASLCLKKTWGHSVKKNLKQNHVIDSMFPKKKCKAVQAEKGRAAWALMQLIGDEVYRIIGATTPIEYSTTS